MTLPLGARGEITGSGKIFKNITLQKSYSLSQKTLGNFYEILIDWFQTRIVQTFQTILGMYVY